MPNTCATCRHWRGDATTYRADCDHNGTATAFDDGCGAWAAREPIVRDTTLTDLVIAYESPLSIADAIRAIPSRVPPPGAKVYRPDGTTYIVPGPHDAHTGGASTPPIESPLPQLGYCTEEVAEACTALVASYQPPTDEQLRQLAEDAGHIVGIVEAALYCEDVQVTPLDGKRKTQVNPSFASQYRQSAAEATKIVERVAALRRELNPVYSAERVDVSSTMDGVRITGEAAMPYTEARRCQNDGTPVSFAQERIIGLRGLRVPRITLQALISDRAWNEEGYEPECTWVTFTVPPSLLHTVRIDGEPLPTPVPFVPSSFEMGGWSPSPIPSPTRIRVIADGTDNPIAPNDLLVVRVDGVLIKASPADDARYIACEEMTTRGELLVQEADDDEDEDWYPDDE